MKPAPLALTALLLGGLLLGAPPAARAGSLADLAWMAGRWIDDSGGNLSEEVWVAPEGDSMMGMWRYVEGGKVRIFELLTITPDADGLVMRLRHFDPRLVGREEKERPVALRLVAAKPREASFEGAEASGKGTVRLTYRRTADDRLACRLEKEGKVEDFSLRRAGAP